MGLLQYPASGSTTSKRQVFTSSGTFILPTGYSAANPLWVRCTAVGGGGGGGQGYTSGGGGGGAVVTRDLALTGNVPIVIGAGGLSGAESSNGGRGGDTIVGNSNTRPVNLLRNPFQTNLYGDWDQTGWTNSTAGGSISVFRSDYSSTTNQFLRNRHFMVDDAVNFQGTFKSSYGITLFSTSGDSTYQFYSDFFDTDAGVLHYYGVYTRLGNSNNTVTVTLEWYDSTGNQLNTANLATFNYATTSDNKYSNSATSPANTTRGRLRITMRVPSTNQFSQLFGAYVSQEVNCAWQYSKDSGGYWTGAYYNSYLTRLNSTGFSTSAMGISDLARHSVGIVAGGGGGGGRAADEGVGGWLQARFGGPGGHGGGFGAGHGEDSDGSSFLFGGDGGGAGTPPMREVFGGVNGTTPFSNDGGFNGINSSGIWRSFSYRMPQPNQYQRFITGNSGTSAIYLSGASSTQHRKFRVEGGRPSKEGYSAGGPGRGYANFANTESTSRYFYSECFAHYRELPYGNGGAAYNGIQNRNTTNFGDIDYNTYGDWSRNGDQGIVTFEFMN